MREVLCVPINRFHRHISQHGQNVDEAHHAFGEDRCVFSLSWFTRDSWPCRPRKSLWTQTSILKESVDIIGFTIVSTNCGCTSEHVPVSLFGDNESVVTSGSIPHSQLNKCWTALSYHRVREAIAAQVMDFWHIPGAENPADMLSEHWACNKVSHVLRPILF